MGYQHPHPSPSTKGVIFTYFELQFGAMWILFECPDLPCATQIGHGSACDLCLSRGLFGAHSGGEVGGGQKDRRHIRYQLPNEPEGVSGLKVAYRYKAF